MYKNLNSWTLGISGRQSELIELALTYGFRGIDIDIQDMIGRSESKGVEHATRFLLSAQKLLRIGGFDLPVVWADDEATYKADLAKLPEIAEMAAMVGAQGCVTTVVAASASLPYQENFELHRERLAEMAERLDVQRAAARRGIVAADRSAAGRRTRRRHPRIDRHDGVEVCDVLGGAGGGGSERDGLGGPVAVAANGPDVRLGHAREV